MTEPALPDTPGTEAGTPDDTSTAPPVNPDVPTPDDLASRHLPPGFDPQIHAVNPDGSPRMTQKGEYAKKRGPRRTANSGIADSASVMQSAPQNLNAHLTDVALVAAKLDAAARLAANLTFNVSVNVFGDEWKPAPEEAQDVKRAYHDYFRANGYMDIPPGWALVLTLGAYALPRLRHENTQTKLQGFVKSVRRLLGLKTT